jgi:hypothetical protein
MGAIGIKWFCPAPGMEAEYIRANETNKRDIK